MAVVTSFLDTNVLIYAFSADSRARQAQGLLERPFIISVQALNEFANVGRRKLGMSWSDLKEAIEAISSAATSVVTINENTTLAALDLAQRYNFSFYDALMVAAAMGVDCKCFYSEDMQHGMLVDARMTIINPFL